MGANACTHLGTMGATVRSQCNKYAHLPMLAHILERWPPQKDHNFNKDTHLAIHIISRLNPSIFFLPLQPISWIQMHNHPDKQQSAMNPPSSISWGSTLEPMPLSPHSVIINPQSALNAQLWLCSTDGAIVPTTCFGGTLTQTARKHTHKPDDDCQQQQQSTDLDRSCTSNLLSE